jgi:hypothetical protein
MILMRFISSVLSFSSIWISTTIQMAKSKKRSKMDIEICIPILVRYYSNGMRRICSMPKFA